MLYYSDSVIWIETEIPIIEKTTDYSVIRELKDVPTNYFCACLLRVNSHTKSCFRARANYR